ncbi:MAG: hypothetical protein CMI32_05115 [Opitutales bacterium]|jgi:hypothetical protein|nr:hypothetical protein [Opitutales bacterium]
MKENVKPLESRSGMAAAPMPFRMKGGGLMVNRMRAVVQLARRLTAVVAPAVEGEGEVPAAGKESS